MIDELKSKADLEMGENIGKLKVQLSKVRTGRASANILDGVKVDYYGAKSPVAQVGQISTPEARLLQIQPFDKTLIAEIEKAILACNLGLTPSNDGNVIRIPFPALTEDKRKSLVKDVKKIGEDSKVKIRNTRRDLNDEIKKAEKSKEISEDDSKKFQGEIQKITDQYISQVDDIVKIKESDIIQL